MGSLRHRLWWIGLCLGCGACGAHPCPDEPPKACSRVEGHSATLQADDSSIAWERGGTMFAASALVSVTPALDQCRVVGPSWQTGVEPSVPARIELACNDDGPSEARMYHVELELTGDSRAWTAGEFDAASCREWYVGCDATYLSPSCGHVVIEEATGVEAPFPNLVSADFARSYRVTLDTFEPALGTREGACSGGMRASLEFHETAANFSATETNCNGGACE